MMLNALYYTRVLSKLQSRESYVVVPLEAMSNNHLLFRVCIIWQFICFT